jgi:hypothetical protein
MSFVKIEILASRDGIIKRVIGNYLSAVDKQKLRDALLTFTTTQLNVLIV